MTRAKRKTVILKLLASVPLFRGLTAPERATIARALVTEEFGAGEAVIREGESGDTMYIVGTVEPGSVFGELALVNSEPRKATIITVSEMTALVLDRQIFERVMGRAQQAVVEC